LENFKIVRNRRKSPSPEWEKNLGTACERASDARSGLRMPRNPYIELYSFIGVGLGRELSFFEKKSLEVENAARLAAERAESASLLVTLGEAAEAGTALEERVVVLESQLAAQVGRAGRERAREREIERERRERKARERGERERREREAKERQQATSPVGGARGAGGGAGVAGGGAGGGLTRSDHTSNIKAFVL
jgi:hypothetical protein